MSAQTLIVLGSGPGIGISVAKLFAQKHFSKIALVSRNTERLQSDKEEVAAAAKDAGKTAQVAVYTTDLNDFDALRKTLNEIEKLGIGAVFYNAARIRPSDILTMSVEELEEDFRVGLPLCREKSAMTDSAVDYHRGIVCDGSMGHPSAAKGRRRQPEAILPRDKQLLA